MSAVGPAIYSKLTTTAGVTALIGSRVYPEYDREADHTYPLAVYKVENVLSPLANDGPIGLLSADAVIAVVATTYKVAEQVAQAVKNALDGGKGTWGGVVVQGCFLKDDGIQDDVVTQPETEAILYYVKELSFDLRYVD